MLNTSLKHHVDYLTIAIVAFLVIFGLVILGSASANLGEAKFGDSYYYLKHQLLFGLLPGLIGYFIASKIYYGKYERAATIIFISTIVLLLLTFSPLGLKAGGALRWLTIGGVTIQPAEIAKLSIIVYLAAWLAGEKERGTSLVKGFLPFLAMLAIVGAILLKQSSTSLFAIILATACIMYFVSGAKQSYLFGTIAIGIIGIITISYFTPYRWSRIMTYIYPEQNKETSGYHINQALIAIGSGGWGGVGLGRSTTKIKYLPEPIGDSIFAVISEELGFIGAITIVGAILILTIRLLLMATKMSHKFGQLLLVGFGSLLGLQSFINIGAITGLLPLTGVPLPFISYGGTSLAVFLTIIGIVTNISMHTRT